MRKFTWQTLAGMLALLLCRLALAIPASVQDGVVLLTDPAIGSQVPPAAVRYWLEERLEDQVIDPDRLLAPEQNGLWQYPPRTGLNFGNLDQPVWLRFEVRNPSAQAGQWLLAIPWSQLNLIEFRVLHGDGRWSEPLKSGYDIPPPPRSATANTVCFSFRWSWPATNKPRC